MFRETRIRAAWFIVVFVTSLGLAVTAHSTTVLQMSLKEMTRESDTIAVGTVVRSEAVWVGRTLATRVTLDVSEMWKGSSRKQIQLVVPGGVDRQRKVSMSVAGMPAVFPIGQRLLVFAVPSESVPGAVRLVGFSQGMFFLRDQTGGQSTARQDLSGVQIQGRDGTRAGRETQARLDALRSRVEGILSNRTRSKR